MHSKVLLAIAIAATLVGTSGCEWDNSDKIERNNSSIQPVNPAPSPAEPNRPDEPEETEDDVNPLALITGTAATSEPINGAKVCLDENANGVCDEGEPTSTTDSEGNWSLTSSSGNPITSDTPVIVKTDPPNTTLADSGEVLDWTFSLSGFVRPGNPGEPITDVFVSPISTLIENERRRLPDNNLDAAILNVASKLGTTADILRNYLNPGFDTDTLESTEYQRIERLARLADQASQEIEKGLSQEDRDALPQPVIDDLIFDRIDQLIPELVSDVDISLILTPEDDAFLPDEILSDARFDDIRQPVTPPRDPETLNQLEQRVDGAVERSSLFQDSGFERFPVVGAQTFDLEILPHPDFDDRVYYEARERINVGADQDEAIVDTRLSVPDAGRNRRTLDDRFCNLQSCRELNARPRTVRALLWTGLSFREDEIQVGHRGTQRVLPVDSLGNLIAFSRSNGFSSLIQFGEFSLAGLSGRTVTEDFLGITLPENEQAANSDWTFGPNAIAYTYKETLGGDILLSQWPQGGPGNLCTTPGMPDASVTRSCNLVYGASARATGEPARSFGDSLYPASQIGQPYSGALENGQPTDALLVTGPTNDTFIARLFGRASDNRGAIVIEREVGGNWQVVSQSGRWVRDPESFDKVRLELPSGFQYQDARIGFRLGEAYLYERQGYLRHGWRVPQETNLDTLVNRRQVRYALSPQAFNELLDGLEAIEVLEYHPIFTPPSFEPD